ncbi:XRE family transcriptional regulator [Xenorhabdus bovienii]|uniref:LexA family protein n=1 Tax=Xenorhabdus bovienii TaxID=40576 RepID=UPI001EDD18A6|nr:XRE family transcriptional regulator [Xenorhabdus bovienii]MCG3470827.1 XRE family transcriptional regulator [Xenorhabdus bovienii]
MKIDDNFKSRISLARRSVNLTQGELAEKAGVVRRQIAAYEAGDSKPREQVLINLAAALGTTADWLSLGIGDSPDLSNIKNTITVHEIPVYTHVQASFLKFNKSKMSPTGFIPAPPNASENAFALELRGDSMTSSDGASFYDGMIITFEPDNEVSNRDLVLVDKVTKLGATFRQLHIDQGKWYLFALNNLYPVVPFNDNMEIIGVATHAQYDISQYKDRNIKQNSDAAPKENPSSLQKRLDKIESMLEQLLNKKAP